jgi:hypothetical protein
MMKKMMVVVLAAGVLVACDRTTNENTSLVVAPTSASGTVVVRVVPHSLPAGVVTATPCAVPSAFPTGFDLVIVQTLPVNMSLDQLTLHMSDGSSPITFPTQQLTTMFGSMLVVGTRTFDFQPQFVCTLIPPGAIVGSAVLTDAEGHARTVSVTVASSH